MRHPHASKKRKKSSKSKFLDCIQSVCVQADRHWFESNPTHRMLVRQPSLQEIRLCEKDMEFTPDVTLVYNLPNGLGPLKDSARMRFFAQYEDCLERKTQMSGQTSIQLYTIAEIVGDHPLPYGTSLLYTRLRSARAA